MWKTEYQQETQAPAERVWALFRDVAGWTSWNAGIESIELHGPFAEGTTFVMTPPGQPPLTSKLVEVRENESFVDVTVVDDLTVRVAHRIERRGAKASLVTYAVEVTGPGAEEVGKMISGDFPQVLEALARRAAAPVA